MKKSIRIIAFCIMLCMCLQGVCHAGTMDYDAFASSLGILPYEDSGSDETLTRGELAYIALKVCGAYINENNENVYFQDFDSKHQYFDEINTAVQLGYMSGYSDGRFEPDYAVTKTDAAITFVNVLGFGMYAEAKGGQPSDYLAVANELNLFRGTAVGDFVTKEQMSRIAYNVLSSDRLGLAFSADGTYAEMDTTFLEDVFNMYEITGKVTANEVTSTDGTGTAGDGEIIIGGVQYLYSGEDYLGYNVRAIIRELDDGDLEVVYIEPTKSNNVIEIKGRKVIDVTQTRDILYDDNEKVEKLRLSDNAAYILNGSLTYSLSLQAFKDKSSYLTFIDNDNDNVYDVVKIEKYQTIVVDSLTTNNEEIVGKYGEMISLTNIETYSIILDGEEISISDLLPWDILSYYISADGQTAKFFCSRESVSGKVTGTGEDNGTVYYIDGEAYRTSESYNELVKQGKTRAITFGTSGRFLLDINGHISAYRTEKENRGFYYGYLIKAKDLIDDDSKMFTIFTEDGVFEELTAARNITIDGKKYKKTDAFLGDIQSGGSYRQLIRYNINDAGEINMIDTQRVKTANGEDAETTLSLDVPVDTNDDKIYNAGMVEGLYYIDDNAIVFSVPPEEYMNDKTMYSVRPAVSYCKTGQGYLFSAYDVDSSYNVAVCLEEGGASSLFEEEYILVTKIIPIFDEASEEITKKLFGYKDGVEFEAMARNEAVVQNVEPGDVIMCSYDAKDRITNIDLILDVSTNPQTFITTNGSGGQYAYHATKRYTYGVVTDVSGDRFRSCILDTSGNYISDSEFFYIVRSSAKVITYERSSGDVTVAPNGTAGDLIKAIHRNNPTARVFIGTYYSGMTCCYLYID